jgi:hypothetical protein
MPERTGPRGSEEEGEDGPGAGLVSEEDAPAAGSAEDPAVPERGEGVGMGFRIAEVLGIIGAIPVPALVDAVAASRTPAQVNPPRIMEKAGK